MLYNGLLFISLSESGKRKDLAGKRRRVKRDIMIVM